MREKEALGMILLHAHLPRTHTLPHKLTANANPSLSPQNMLPEPRQVTAHYAAGEGEEGEEQKVRATAWLRVAGVPPPALE